VPATICPKCGFQQDGGTECARCGVIFAKCFPAAARPGRTPDPKPPRAGLLHNVYRVFRWVSLAVLVLILLLILMPSSPPRVSVSADATARAEAKAQSFQSLLQKGEPATLQMDEPELNGWLGANLALKRTGNPDPVEKSSREVTAAAAKRAMAMSPSRVSALPGHEVSIQEVQSSVREVRIELREDDLRGYVLFEVYGKAVSLELEGRLTVRDGCLTLDPTAGKLGSLPLPSGTLQSAARRLFESPENKEKFRLPPEIRNVAVKQKRILISNR
jgi:hypothetical protein